MARRDAATWSAHVHVTSAAAGEAIAMGTWRMAQGIYRIDPDLYPALIATPAAEA